MPPQIGGRKQKPALDASLLLQNIVEEAWARKETTAIQSLDVKGAFDYVATNQLLAK